MGQQTSAPSSRAQAKAAVDENADVKAAKEDASRTLRKRQRIRNGLHTASPHVASRQPSTARGEKRRRGKGSKSASQAVTEAGILKPVDPDENGSPRKKKRGASKSSAGPVLDQEVADDGLSKKTKKRKKQAETGSNELLTRPSSAVGDANADDRTNFDRMNRKKNRRRQDDAKVGRSVGVVRKDNSDDFPESNTPEDTAKVRRQRSKRKRPAGEDGLAAPDGHGKPVHKKRRRIERTDRISPYFTTPVTGPQEDLDGTTAVPQAEDSAVTLSCRAIQPESGRTTRGGKRNKSSKKKNRERNRDQQKQSPSVESQQGPITVDFRGDLVGLNTLERPASAIVKDPVQVVRNNSKRKKHKRDVEEQESTEKVEVPAERADSVSPQLHISASNTGSTAPQKSVDVHLDDDLTIPLSQARTLLDEAVDLTTDTAPKLVKPRRSRRRTTKTASTSSYFSPSSPLNPPASLAPPKRMRISKPKAPTASVYFADLDAVQLRGRVPKGVSVIPWPPFTATRFGLIQEELADHPFQLLVATVFLNRTRGVVAVPILRSFLARYPTARALAAADEKEIENMIQPLGLHRTRAKRLVEMGKAWELAPATKGVATKKAGYPAKDTAPFPLPGREPLGVKRNLEWEVGHIPGVGPYALDSWRIFCRDKLREVEEGEEEEWRRVVPKDKELRAYLRWKWAAEGRVWVEKGDGEDHPSSWPRGE